MSNMKYIKVSRDKITKVLNACTLISYSMQDYRTVIREFNSLTVFQRNTIKQEQSKKEKILQDKIREAKDLPENVALLCTFADLNMIATNYNIDPNTVCLCISKLCKTNEKIIIV